MQRFKTSIKSSEKYQYRMIGLGSLKPLVLSECFLNMIIIIIINHSNHESYALG